MKKVSNKLQFNNVMPAQVADTLQGAGIQFPGLRLPPSRE